jgi:hypothetical protein
MTVWVVDIMMPTVMAAVQKQSTRAFLFLALPGIFGMQRIRGARFFGRA